ncbi:MAG TPA: nucleoside hydrolase [Cyclobacteriaceae bacterium]|nr:nucleoside hydrolase [Cyclobacteriaceae bacterium]
MKQIFSVIFFALMITIQSIGSEKQKIILDCDLGGDIDDAYAVALVLASPEFEVLGLVMDDGNTPGRAEVACKMLYECGLENIPVIVGEKTDDDIELQFSWSRDFDKLKPVSNNATDFIISNLRKYPNEVILFTVGPVTNIKSVLAKDPDVLKLAKHVYSMFGSFYRGYDLGPVPSNEWNVRANVAASKMLASSGAKITYIGLDVTMLVRLDEEYRDKLAMRNSPLTDALVSLQSLWGSRSHGYQTPVLHDALAVAVVIWPDLITTRKAFVKVIDDGYTVIDESKEPNSEVALTVKADEFTRRLVERLMHQNLGRK